MQGRYTAGGRWTYCTNTSTLFALHLLCNWKMDRQQIPYMQTEFKSSVYICGWFFLYIANVSFCRCQSILGCIELYLRKTLLLRRKKKPILYTLLDIMNLCFMHFKTLIIFVVFVSTFHKPALLSYLFPPFYKMLFKIPTTIASRMQAYIMLWT